MSTFSINGFGRIGRLTVRVWWQFHRKSLVLAAINTSGSMDITGWAHLLKYDTTYGLFPADVSFETYQSAKDATDEDPLIGYLILDHSHKIPVLAQRDPHKIPWDTYQVNTVIESTGVFTSAEKASAHLSAGAKQVVISAPAKGPGVPTSVIGVNAEQVLPRHNSHSVTILNNASCTTNCAAPVARVIANRLGIVKAAMTTIHSYTDDQNLQDGSHHDLRRARAAAHNIVPTSTGAAQAVAETLPELKGIFDGLALRVPTITGSLTDFTFVVTKPTTVEAVNHLFRSAVLDPSYERVLAVTDEPLVSSDIIGRRESAIVDLSLTQVIAGDLVKVFAWYDNEWGYSNRLVETVVDLINS